MNKIWVLGNPIILTANHKETETTVVYLPLSPGPLNPDRPWACFPTLLSPKPSSPSCHSSVTYLVCMSPSSWCSPWTLYTVHRSHGAILEAGTILGGGPNELWPHPKWGPLPRWHHEASILYREAKGQIRNHLWEEEPANLSPTGLPIEYRGCVAPTWKWVPFWSDHNLLWPLPKWHPIPGWCPTASV